MIFSHLLISYSFYPHNTLPTRFSNSNRTLMDDLFCKLTNLTVTLKPCILTKQLSDHVVLPQTRERFLGNATVFFQMQLS